MKKSTKFWSKVWIIFSIISITLFYNYFEVAKENVYYKTIFMIIITINIIVLVFEIGISIIKFNNWLDK